MNGGGSRGGRVGATPRGHRHTVPVVPTPADPAQSAAPTDPATPTFLRRVGAVLVDWVLSQLVAVFLLGADTTAGGVQALAPLGVFAVLNLVLVAATGSTVGHRLFGMQVWQVRPGSFPLQVLVRTVLLCLFLPAVLTSSDGRGFHDVWAGTRIVRL